MLCSNVGGARSTACAQGAGRQSVCWTAARYEDAHDKQVDSTPRHGPRTSKARRARGLAPLAGVQTKLVALVDAPIHRALGKQQHLAHVIGVGLGCSKRRHSVRHTEGRARRVMPHAAPRTAAQRKSDAHREHALRTPLARQMHLRTCPSLPLYVQTYTLGTHTVLELLNADRAEHSHPTTRTPVATWPL